jgi:hypothetical protein
MTCRHGEEPGCDRCRISGRVRYVVERTSRTITPKKPPAGPTVLDIVRIDPATGEIVRPDPSWRCGFLGRRIEFLPGCQGGFGCLHECGFILNPDVVAHLSGIMVARPSVDCKDCPGNTRIKTK